MLKGYFSCINNRLHYTLHCIILLTVLAVSGRFDGTLCTDCVDGASEGGADDAFAGAVAGRGACELFPGAPEDDAGSAFS